jgi:Flp pilus assembly protein TadD
MLSDALWDLRVGANPRIALSRLDLYARLYPRGRLAEEAMMVRAEALFRSGDETKTLAILDQVALGERSGQNALRLVRGELRAIRGRCGEALDDFRAAAALATRDDAAERALYGRAACHARLGNTEQARRELGDYLSRFPHGKHRADAERYLGESVPHRPTP